MRPDVAIKLIPLALIAVATSFATESAMASGDKKASQAKKQKPTANPAIDPSGLMPEGTISLGYSRPLQPGPLPQIEPISRPGVSSIGSVSVVPVGEGFYRVSAKASVGSAGFVWGLRVRNTKDQSVAYEMVYDDQVFRMGPQENPMRRTFEDLLFLAVEPGEYKVELMAFRVPPQGDTDILYTVEAKNALILAKNTAYLTIQ